ncbi:Chromatin remodeling complex subunit, putative [Candida maltosa Xu316]|uniref:Chromatin remodeling complex subunit, putative n=1 Tax=Candida maltosa (strain Xu316) TaxID=1245528 RepID=M3HU26_CANMX|nr:Chromatin remodeling complex subunit, putative [Candida maltosa Xu316]
MTKDIENSVPSIKFEKILPDLFKVYEHTNNEVVTSKSLPIGFYEEDSIRILDALQVFDVKETTSLEDKFKDGLYTTPYQLYHDIKVVSSILLNKSKRGSSEYKEYDFFYKFSTELLLREVGNALTFNNKLVNIKNELESQLDDDFSKIVRSYNLANQEVLTYISTTEEPALSNSGYYQPQYQQETVKKVQPLFSSIISKSELDNKKTIVKDPYGVAQVIPNIKDTVSENVLDSLSPISTKIPSPLDQPTNILHDFFHPTWYTVSMPQWLTYRSQAIKPLGINAISDQDIGTSSTSSHKLSILQNRENEFANSVTNSWGPGIYYNSFAPSRDSSKSIVGHKLRANIWLQHIGMDIIAKIKKSYMETNYPSDKEGNEKEKEVDSDKKEPEKEEKQKETETEKSKEVDGESEINLASLSTWNPSQVEELKFLKNHKEDLINPKKLQKMISTSLLKLNKLRQERIARSDVRNPLAPENNEYVLYNRLVKLISIAIELVKLNPGDFSYEFSKNIPVLVSEFSGTLPGVAPNKIVATNSATVNTTKSNRLPTLRGPAPYRKRPSRY